jgi:hypothetical protein
MFIAGASLLPPDPVTEQNNRLGMRQQEQIEVTLSACGTTDCASSLISWPADTDRSDLSLRAVTSTVMRKREKRTGAWRGLGNLLSFEIDDRAHDVRTSGNRQKHEDENTRMRNLVCKIGHGTAQRGTVE